MQHLRIFLSSPSDVSHERQLALETIARIGKESTHRDLIELEVVAWDKPGAGTAMPAQLEPQEAIDKGLRKPSECDIVIVIFWARMGTLLSEKHRKADGSRYRSGTEYEYLDALGSAKKTGKPDVLVYRRKKPPDVNLADPQREEKEKQWDLVEEFFAEFRNPDGSFKSFYKEYGEPSDFEKQLGDDLRDIITKYLDSHPIDKANAIDKLAEDAFQKTLAVLQAKEAELQVSLGLVFRELVEVDEREAVSRRRASLSQVTDGAMAEALVKALFEARLLVKSPGENNQPAVEVADEAIFTHWHRLSRWIKEHIDELRICRRLTFEAMEWQRAGAPRFRYLPDRSTLKEYRRVRSTCPLGDDAEVVRRFLSTGRARQRVFAGFLVLGVVLLSLLGTEIWRSRDIMNWNVLRIWTLAKVGWYEGPPMVEIRGDDFQMGSSECSSIQPEDKRYAGCDQHPVKVRTFWIGKYEVTFDEYSAFWLDSKDVELPSDSGFGRGSRPVINISWREAKKYAEWLKKVTGKPFRLPTEAEWEYAARSTSTTRYWWGDDVQEGGKVWANCANCGSEWDGAKTAPVGSFPKNGFGLHDMNGNVWEWVEDDWHDSYKGAPDDGSAWIDKPRGSTRVIRGGSWYDEASNCPSAWRWEYAPGDRGDDVGFRLCRSVALGP